MADTPAREDPPMADVSAARAEQMPVAGPRPRWKRWLFRFMAGSLVIGIIELLSWVTVVILPVGSDRAELAKAQKTIAEGGASRTERSEVLHPYLGWVLTPGLGSGVTIGDRDIPVNSLGFVDDGETLYKRSEDRLLVGVCGGSVAQQMSLFGEQTLRQLLESAPEFRGKRIQFVRLATSGFKQPQQLMALNYVLSLGGELDVLINVDGYNEIALTLAGNIAGHSFAAYPNNWDARLEAAADPHVASLSFRLLETRALRQEWASWIQTSWCRHTWTGSMVWALRDYGLQAKRVELGNEYRAHRDQSGHGFERDGPRQTFANSDEKYSHAVNLWAECSRLQAQVCRARGIRYLHCLQPNQYHVGSKPLSVYELKDCFVEDQDYGLAVKRGYPQMISEGLKLRSQGVDFHDLTPLFADQTETIYCDYFCHYNQKGNDLLAAAVARLLLDSMRAGER
ncbi:MAG: hypothetical protein ACKV2Q_11765 [Planctomycetaceae bacterium]